MCYVDFRIGWVSMNFYYEFAEIPLIPVARFGVLFMVLNQFNGFYALTRQNLDSPVMGSISVETRF